MKSEGDVVRVRRERKKRQEKRVGPKEGIKRGMEEGWEWRGGEERSAYPTSTTLRPHVIQCIYRQQNSGLT